LLAVLDSYARDPIGSGQPLPTDVKQRLVPALRAHPTTLAFLAFEGERAVGLALCFTGFSTFRALPLINVHDLAVLPDCRGQGVGRRLLEAVEARARSLGCGKITLEVREDNAGARGLYDSFGFGAGQTPTFFLEKPLA
jgi:ribosomal protein S18 acetylase RimI-like enzyme